MLITVAVLTLVIVVTHIITIPGRRGRDRILSCNHPALLAACRELIANRQSFSNEVIRSWSDGTFVDGKSEQLLKMPTIIQQLQPLHVDIGTDCVVVYVAIPPRAIVVGFAAGAKQSGTRKLIDGLWLWGG